jgi:hypothetical protein
VAVNWRTKQLLLGECKWGAADVGKRVIRNLVEKTDKVLPGDSWTVHYAFFARRGFSPAAQMEARNVGAITVTLRQMEDDIIRWMKGRRRGLDVIQ